MTTFREKLKEMRQMLDTLEHFLDKEEISEARVPDVIDDPLAWQDEIDKANMSLNLRGSGRFWDTVFYHTGQRFARSSAPELGREIMLPLTDTVGLLLYADYNRYVAGPDKGKPVQGDDFFVSLEYRFISIAFNEERQMWDWGYDYDEEDE